MIFRLVIFSIIVMCIAKVSTLGWRFFTDSSINLSKNEVETKINLQNIVKHLSHDIGNRNYAAPYQLNQTADFIVESLQNLEYKITIMPYQVNGQTFKNIIAEKETNVDSNECIIIGAHYDTCFNPGADDNASAVAGLLELARLMREENTKTHIKFIAFVNEEPPFFMTENMGSRVYARKAKESGEKIKAAIILEMIGYYSDKRNSQRYLPLMGLFYPNQGNFIAIIGNFSSNHIVSKMLKSWKKHSKFPIEGLVSPSFLPGISYSDHWSFWKERFPAVMITDTAYLRNPNYHQQTDLHDTLDYEKMALVVHTLRASILTFANE